MQALWSGVLPFTSLSCGAPLFSNSFTVCDLKYNKNIYTMERLDQGHLHPYVKHPSQVCPGRG